MTNTKLNIRAGVCIALSILMALVMGGRLVNMQILGSSSKAAAKEQTALSSVTVPAARGEILDRYGRPLVSNRMGMNLTVDSTQLNKAEEPARVLLALLEAVVADGSQPQDSLPISAPPFAYESALTPEQSARMTHFLTKKKFSDKQLEALSELGFGEYDWNGLSYTGEATLKESLPPVDAMIQALALSYGIPDDFTLEQMRRVVGVFYELELQYMYTRVEPYLYITPYILAEDVSVKLVSIIKEQGWPGVNIEMASTRVYNTSFAAHLLGRVGQIPEERIDEYLELGYSRSDIVGIDGAELAFEEYLRGKSGTQTVEKTTGGTVTNVLYTKDPEPGQNVYLTIDIRFQAMVERILADGIETLRLTGQELRGLEAEAGAIAVVHVPTGEILALANYPTYNLATFKQDYALLLQDELTPLLNRSISGLYTPGSTYKMVTAAAALEEGLITLSGKVTDTRTYPHYHNPSCTGTHGTVNVCDALKVSCNFFFFEMGYRIQEARLNAAMLTWANNFGLGLPTGIELQGEKTGYVGSAASAAEIGRTWYPGDMLSAVIGQGDNQFTPLQLANYAAAIANGGTVYNTHLLRETKSYDYSQTYYIQAPTVGREVGAQETTINALRLGMYQVANTPGGTGYRVFQGFPIEVAAKTGSVQINDRPNNGVFVAYAPFDNPEIALCVVIEKGGAGSVIAPIAREVFEAWFELRGEMEKEGQQNVLQK